MSNVLEGRTLTQSGKRAKRDWNRTMFKFFFLLPAVAILFFFMYYPIEETFRLSFTRSTGLNLGTYIGFRNYISLFGDPQFQAGLIHVFEWAFWSVVIQIPLAFFVAFSVTNYKNRVTQPLRAIYFLANVLPSAITAMLGRFMFEPHSGVIVTLATKLHWNWLANIDFLGNPKLAFWSVFGIATWAYIGFGIIYLMANIEQIPTEIREAAQLDGAGRWQFAWYVVIPMTSYAIRILSILAVVGSLKLFDLPWLVTNGGPGDATQTLGTILYQQGFINWQYGKGAAIGVIIFLLSLVFTIIQFSWRRKETRAA